MNNNESNKWLRKIRALLAKAEDSACTPEEAEAFTERATDLIAKYGVDQALIDADRPEKQVPGDLIIPIDGKYGPEKQRLLGWIAHELGCRGVRRWERERKGQPNRYSVHVFGFAADIERVQILYTSLLVQMANGIAKAEAPTGENVAAFRRSWMYGFANAVAARIHEAEERAKANAQQDRGADRPGVALVLTDRTALVEKAKEARYPGLPDARRPQFSGSGFHAGHEAGQNADIGGTRIDSQATTGNVLTSA